MELHNTAERIGRNTNSISNFFTAPHLYGGGIDWNLIADHWEDYLRVVLAIQTGRISASWILTRLNSHSRNNRLYRALKELGRVVRTVYLIHWIGMDELRSGVTDAANKVESFHQFSSHLRFGSHGVLRTNEPDEQEKAVVYNELVANAVMLQTVADLTRILQDLQGEGYPVNTTDCRIPQPVCYGTIEAVRRVPNSP